MSESTTVAVRDTLNLGVDDIGRVAKMFALSGFFPATNSQDLNLAIAKAGTVILAGQELGVGPMQAMQNIILINGKPTLSASLIGALVKRSNRYRYSVAESSTERCLLRWEERYEDGWHALGESEFTINEAKAAGLAGKDVWKKYTSDMLFARALTRGARRFAQDVFNGAAYSPEELSNGEPPELPALELEAAPLATGVGVVAEAGPPATASPDAVEEAPLEPAQASATTLFVPPPGALDEVEEPAYD